MYYNIVIVLTLILLNITRHMHLLARLTFCSLHTCICRSAVKNANIHIHYNFIPSTVSYHCCYFLRCGFSAVVIIMIIIIL